MKKLFAVLLVIAAILSLASCGWKFPGTPESSAATSGKPSESMLSESPSSSQPPKKTAVDDFLTVEPTVSQLGQYIKDHAKDLQPEDNDKLLERLLLVQLDVTLDMSLKIWNEPYMTALNTTMGGVLNPDKIQYIEDPTVRSDFQLLSDGLMTVVRYEETPGVETDWGALSKLKDAFSPQAAFMIEYRYRLQGAYYRDEKTGLDLMAADIAAIEKKFPATHTGYIRWQMQALYARLVGTLLYGPEGSYLSDLTSGKQAVLDRLAQYAKKYSGAKFGDICISLLNISSKDQQAIIDTISGSTVFTPDDSRTIEIVVRKVNGASLRIPRISEKENSSMTQKINKTIDDTARAMLQAGATGQAISNLSTVSGNYLSVTLSYNYTDKNGQNGFVEKYLTFDLRTGKSVTLDSLAGKTYPVYQDLLLKALHGEKVPATLKGPLDFTLSGNGIVIYIIPKDSSYPENYIVSLNGLRAFMDISPLY